VVTGADRGSQYTAIRHIDRLSVAGVLASVASTGDSYDNAPAESTIGWLSRSWRDGSRG
jgi:transposase InsO family protein